MFIPFCSTWRSFFFLYLASLSLSAFTPVYTVWLSGESSTEKEKDLLIFTQLALQIGLVAYSSNNCTLCAVAAGLSIRCKCSAHWHVIISVTSWSFSISGCLHGALTYRICINCCVYHTLDPHPTYPPLPKKCCDTLKLVRTLFLELRGTSEVISAMGFQTLWRKLITTVAAEA